MHDLVECRESLGISKHFARQGGPVKVPTFGQHLGTKPLDDCQKHWLSWALQVTHDDIGIHDDCTMGRQLRRHH